MSETDVLLLSRAALAAALGFIVGWVTGLVLVILEWNRIPLLKRFGHAGTAPADSTGRGECRVRVRRFRSEE